MEKRRTLRYDPPVMDVSFNSFKESFEEET